MNPGGKVLDIEGIQALGEDVNIPRTPPPDKLFDIVRDLNNQKGRGTINVWMKMKYVNYYFRELSSIH